jgi:tetrahydromethanopterin S-methyltransferase subunit A
VSATTKPSFQQAVSQLREAVRAKKCRRCGCLRSSLEAIQRAFPKGSESRELTAVLQSAEEKLQAVKYDCLGCSVCYPAIAVNALNVGVDACPTDDVEEQDGWPPLPGSYTILRYQASVALCTLTNEILTEAIAAKLPEEVAIVGTLQTENLGIERIVLNTLANPHIRFLVLCGADTQQAVGHLPGQALVALAQSGVDERMRIIGARGRRPHLPNLSAEAVGYFRKTVEVIDLIGAGDS